MTDISASSLSLQTVLHSLCYTQSLELKHAQFNQQYTYNCEHEIFSQHLSTTVNNIGGISFLVVSLAFPASRETDNVSPTVQIVASQSYYHKPKLASHILKLNVEGEAETAAIDGLVS